MVEQIPLELIINKMRGEIATTLEEIRKKYSISPIVFLMAVEKVINDSKISIYENTLYSINLQQNSDQEVPDTSEDFNPSIPNMPEEESDVEE